MAVDINSLLIGGGITLLLISIAVIIVANLLLGKARTQIKYVLTKLYSRLSLMMIAIFDVVAMFDPSQTILGLALSIVTGITIFLIELLEPVIHEKKFKPSRIAGSLIGGIIAAVIVAIPLPITGLFVAWFGMAGDKKKQ